MRYLSAITTVAVVLCATPFAVHAHGDDDDTDQKAKKICPQTEEYWEHHETKWPVNSFTLGSTSYTADQALAILKLDDQPRPHHYHWDGMRDASVPLAEELISASLNLAHGAGKPAQVSKAIADANALLSTSVPEHVDPHSAVGKKMLAVAEVLEDYNEREIKGSCAGVPVTVPAGSCQPASSLTVLVNNTAKTVAGYVPKGNWSSGAPGISVVNVEGSSVTPTLIPTGTDIINSCAANGQTGQTVCTSNGTNVYVLSGTSISSTLASAGTSTIHFSGGECTTCGVTMDGVHNQAAISVSTAAGGGGFQILNLSGSTPTLGPVFASEAPLGGGVANISEDSLIDPSRNSSGGSGALIISASESNHVELVDITNPASPQFFEQTVSGVSGDMDSGAEDCSTGIVLAPVEFSAPSQIYLADLKQATFTPGSPAGTWSDTGSQLQSLTESILAAGASGVAIAQGTHTGIVTGEFGGSALTAIALPSTSGSGVPAISDWVTCSIPGFSNGLDPHTVTAYVSPASGDAIAVLANEGASQLAVVDLTQLLNPTTLPRTAGGHGCASGALPASLYSTITVP
jgi:hypothetical protein